MKSDDYIQSVRRAVQIYTLAAPTLSSRYFNKKCTLADLESWFGGNYLKLHYLNYIIKEVINKYSSILAFIPQDAVESDYLPYDDAKLELLFFKESASEEESAKLEKKNQIYYGRQDLILSLIRKKYLIEEGKSVTLYQAEELLKYINQSWLKTLLN